jgi:cation diffusion facilitator CzcD-associated flavoprotein CzcO
VTRRAHPTTTPPDGGVLILGAGPAGLACTLALRCHGLDEGLRVVDPAGRWMAAWERRFDAQDIQHLRSPAVHHPHPDPFAMIAEGAHGLLRSGGTRLPTSARFAEFCHQVVSGARLEDAVEPAEATGLSVDAAGRPRVTLSTGRVLRPDRLVLATNARHPVVPPAFAGLTADPRVRHAEQAHVDRAPAGGRLLVVGGGLSAAQLAVGAARRGAHVTLLTRRALTVRRFDVHPTWLGPRKRRPFEREPDPAVRRREIDRARGGGSIPARMRREIETCVEAGSLRLLERRGITDATTSAGGVTVGLDGEPARTYDEVWLSTGSSVDVAADPLCAPLVQRRATPVVGGLPELDADLSWPGTRVHLTGFAAALRLGPTAGNLVGHRRAALRIAAGRRGLDPDRADRVATGAGACPEDAGLPAHRDEHETTR